MQLFHLATLHPSDPLGLLIILFLPQNSFSVLLCLLEKEKRDEDFISGQIYATNTRLFTWIKCKLHRIENVIIFKLNYRPLRRRQWYPTPVLLPGNSHGRRSLVGCSLWGLEEWDTTERLHFHFHALEKEMATHSSVLA